MKKQLDLFDEENKKEIEKQILELKNDLMIAIVLKLRLFNVVKLKLFLNL